MMHGAGALPRGGRSGPLGGLGAVAAFAELELGLRIAVAHLLEHFLYGALVIGRRDEVAGVDVDGDVGA